jgi:hypothetical protein
MLLDASLLGAAYRNRTDDMGLVSGAVSLSVSGAGHNPAMKLRRLRDGDVLENGEVVLVRGGDLAPDILSADAVRYYSIYGTYGISVFAVRDATVDELAQQVPLIRFGSLALLKVGGRPGCGDEAGADGP